MAARGRKMGRENWSEKHISPAEPGQKVFNKKKRVTAAGAKSMPCTEEGTLRIIKL